MSNKKQKKQFTLLVSDSFGNTEEKGTYEVAFRRWLVREIEEERMSVKEAIARFNINPSNGASLIQTWQKKYAPEIMLSLPVMTEKERQKVEELQKKLKEMEKQLEHAQMKNIALETLIDVAEEKLKITIRKKPGAKQ
jgi:transposase